MAEVEQEAPLCEAGSAEELELLSKLQETLPTVVAEQQLPDDLVLGCLRGRKYNLARAVKLAPELVALLEELSIGSWSEQLESDLRSGKLVFTGAKDAEGRAVAWVRLRYHFPKECPAREMQRLAATVMLTALVSDPDVARCGILIFQDMSGIGMKNVDISVGKKIFQQVLPRLPVRLAKIVIYNPPAIVGRLVLPIILVRVAASDEPPSRRRPLQP